jgi:hypothetical protein
MCHVLCSVANGKFISRRNVLWRIRDGFSKNSTPNIVNFLQIPSHSAWRFGAHVRRHKIYDLTCPRNQHGQILVTCECKTLDWGKRSGCCIDRIGLLAQATRRLIWTPSRWQPQRSDPLMTSRNILSVVNTAWKIVSTSSFKDKFIETSAQIYG